MIQDELYKIVVTGRLSNGQSHTFQTFRQASVTVSGPFVKIYHKHKRRPGDTDDMKDGTDLEDWFSVGSVLRIEKTPEKPDEGKR